MSGYRDTAVVPVVTCLGQVLVAIHPDSGDKVWSRPLAEPVRRMVVAWRHLFVADGSPRGVIEWLDVHTGELRGRLEAGFEVTAALARGTRVWFAGSGVALGLSADGSVVFRAGLEGEHVVGRDPAGRELWRVPAAGPAGDGVLLVGDAVAQPDLAT